MVTQPAAIAWEASLPAACVQAAQEDKPVLVNFTDAPHCEASVAMDAVTFPDPRVVDFVRHHFVPVKMEVQQELAAVSRYGIAWTPALLLLDEQGVEQYRAEGYFSPEDLLARLSLGFGRCCLNLGRFDRACARFEEVVNRHQGSDAGAEALYWLGVAQLKESGDPNRLRACWQKLIQNYPASDWAKRARIPELNP